MNDLSPAQKAAVDTAIALLALHQVPVWSVLEALAELQAKEFPEKRREVAVQQAWDVVRSLRASHSPLRFTLTGNLMDDGDPHTDESRTGCWVQMWVMIPNERLPPWE